MREPEGQCVRRLFVVLRFVVLAGEPRLEEIARGGPPLVVGDVDPAVEVVDASLAYVSDETRDYAARTAAVTSGGIAVFAAPLSRKLAYFQQQHGLPQTGRCDTPTLKKIDELAVLKSEAQGRFALVLSQAPFVPPRFVLDETANTKTTEFAAGTGPGVVVPVGGTIRIRLKGASTAQVYTAFPGELRVREVEPTDGMRVFEVTGLRSVARAVPLIAATQPDRLPLTRCWVEVSDQRRLTVYLATTGTGLTIPPSQWETLVNQKLKQARLPYQVDVHPAVVRAIPREGDAANVFWPNGRREVVLNTPGSSMLFTIWEWQEPATGLGCYVESLCKTEFDLSEILREVFAGVPGAPELATVDFARPRIAPRGDTLPAVPQVFSAEVRGLEVHNGFDDTAVPPYQMVPVGEIRDIELVDPSVDWSDVRLSKSNALAVHLESQRTLPDRLRLSIRGNAPTQAPIRVQAKLAGRLVAELEVSVKRRRQIRAGVALLRSDALGVRTVTRREDLHRIFEGVNVILQRQANVEVVLGRIQEFNVANVSNPIDDFDINTKQGVPDPTAELSIFFAWAIDGAWGHQQNNTILVNGERESELALVSTVAHEVGHYLGLEHSIAGGELLMSILNDPEDNRLTRGQIEIINPR